MRWASDQIFYTKFGQSDRIPAKLRRRVFTKRLRPPEAEEHPEGAVMTVTLADPIHLAKLRGLGFIGVMTLGAHHQGHHLAIATGAAPHD